MANIFRGPLYTAQVRRPAPQPDAFPNLLIRLAVVASVPFFASDLPTPLKRAYAPIVEHVPNTLILGIPQRMGFNQSDWVTPLKAKQTRFDDPPNSLIGGIPQRIGFNQYDWPTPQKPRQTRFDDPPNTLAAGIPQRIPFGQFDWTVQARKPARFDDPSNSLIRFAAAPVAAPFAQSEWPQPLARRPIGTDQPTRFAGVIPQPFPFAQSEWPTPARARRDVGGLELEAFNTTLLTVVARPFAQAEWPQPYRIRFAPSALEGSSFAPPWRIPPLQLFAIPVTVGLPNITGQHTLTAAGFVVGQISFVASQSVQPGIILASDPIAGLLEPKGLAVNLSVSSGAFSPVTRIPTQRASSGNLPQQIPPPNHPIVDKEGKLAASWWRFILNVSQHAFGSNTQAEATIAVGASPFVYTAPVNAVVIVSGGPVTLIEYSRNQSPFYPLGQTGGQIQVLQFDQLRITYDHAPAMTLFPR